MKLSGPHLAYDAFTPNKKNPTLKSIFIFAGKIIK